MKVNKEKMLNKFVDLERLALKTRFWVSQGRAGDPCMSELASRLTKPCRAHIGGLPELRFSN